mgnify:CR=1 FL=1
MKKKQHIQLIIVLKTAMLRFLSRFLTQKWVDGTALGGHAPFSSDKRNKRLPAKASDLLFKFPSPLIIREALFVYML